jgi:MFS transporter, OFA family, oxalate/formate antiporter
MGRKSNSAHFEEPGAKMKNRWLVALAATVVMICLGPVYSWSSFTQPLIAGFHWTNATTTWAFSICIFCLGVGAIIGGRWQDISGPRPVALTGVFLWGLGNVLAGLGTVRYGAPWLRVTYGVIGGVGLGLGYVTPVAAVTKWFPEKRGLASGLVVMGFGLGAFFYSNILKMVPAFALAGKDVHILMKTFVISGVVFAVVGGICALYLSNPPTVGTTAKSSISGAAGERREFTPAQAMGTFQFYALWLMLFLNVTAGILFISNAVPIMRELTGMQQLAAVSLYGFLTVFNGLGRFFWGAVSDRIGRNLAYVLIYGTQVVIFFFVGHLHATAAVAALFAIVLLDYGGGFGTMPSFTADYFGTRYMGLIYGWILLAWGVGGIVGPIFVAVVKDHTGSFTGALPIIAGVLLVATILPLVTRKPRAREAGLH